MSIDRADRLNKKVIAISVSQNEDLLRLGLFAHELDQLLKAIVTPLALEGAVIAYAGDLRPGSYTQRLFKDTAEAYRSADINSGRALIWHFVAASVWSNWESADLADHVRSLGEAAQTTLFLPGGAWFRLTGSESDISLSGSRPEDGERTLVSDSELDALWESLPKSFDNARALSEMRRAMAAACDARIVVGGRVSGYTGDKPGIGEEALTSLEAGKIVIPLGGFGGCARDVAIALGCLPGGAAIRHLQVGVGYYETMAAIGVYQGQFQAYFKDVEVMLMEAAETDSPSRAAEHAFDLLRFALSRPA